MRSLFLFLALAPATFAAGPVLFGVRSGVPFQAANSPISGFGAFNASKRFQVGPTVGLRLPLGFSVEGDALFRRETFDVFDFGPFNANTHFDSWEFPVMLKFTPGNQIIAPVFGAGGTVRRINDFGDFPGFLFGSTSSNTVGFVAGGGVRFQLGPVQVTPEVRYTRWTGDNFLRALTGLLPLSRNEGSFLVGVTF